MNDELPSYYNAMEEGLVTGIKKQTGQNFFALKKLGQRIHVATLLRKKNGFAIPDLAFSS